jgi:hypothetical protein
MSVKIMKTECLKFKALVDEKGQEKTEVLRGKRVSVQLCPPQKSQAVVQDRNQASAVMELNLHFT